MLERRGDGAGQRGLADAGLAFEEQRPAEPEREEERDRQAVVGDVVLRGEPLLQVGNGLGGNGGASPGSIACGVQRADLGPTYIAGRTGKVGPYRNTRSRRVIGS